MKDETIELKVISEDISTAENIGDTVITEKSRNTKKRKRKKRKKKHYLLRLVIIILLGTGMFFIMSSDYFDIKTVTVKGIETLKEKDVIEESEIKTGDNIFAVNKSRVKKLMKENPYYEEIKISKKLPDEIVITVTERKEFAVLPYGERFVVIDKNGIVMKLGNSSGELSQITGITIKEMDKGEEIVTSDEKAFEESMKILNLASEKDLFFKKIDSSGSKIKINVYDNLYIKGGYEDIIANMEKGNIRNVLIDLYQKKVKRGTVLIEGTEQCSFTPSFN